MNNPFDYTPDISCTTAFQELIERIAKLKNSDNPHDLDFIREIENGKMLGVLIATDNNGTRHTLYAFSGQLRYQGFLFPGFTAPVFDYLQPEGYFKTHERDISRQTLDINQYEKEVVEPLREEYRHIKQQCESAVEAFRETCRISKKKRAAKRESGKADEEELAAMIRQSQYEKAELHRLKKRMASKLEPYAEKLKNTEKQLEVMRNKRRRDSEALQEWLFTNFRLLNARSESKNLREIFRDTPMRIPPSGAGECCAPKLLQEAYRQGWQPEFIAEYWYGKPKEGELRIHGQYYPACRGKCGPVLHWMLQGLDIKPSLDEERIISICTQPEIIFENRWFCVVNKPTGMLSVPGKGHSLSLQQWLTEKYGADRHVMLAHRLDQDTSGLMIAAFGNDSYKELQRLFALRKIHKTYIADLEGNYTKQGLPGKGRIELPLSPDIYDRPRQRVDHRVGKEAITDYEFIYAADGRSRIMLQPHTGRTHQLRVHCAATDGLGMPIVGDRLYGLKSGAYTERLHLHACKIEFTSSFDAAFHRFESPLPF